MAWVPRHILEHVGLCHKLFAKLDPRLAVDECPVPYCLHALGPFVGGVCKHLSPQLAPVELEAETAVADGSGCKVKRLRPPERQNISPAHMRGDQWKPDCFARLIWLVMSVWFVRPDAKRL
jgi:hypothetical protein